MTSNSLQLVLRQLLTPFALVDVPSLAPATITDLKKEETNFGKFLEDIKDKNKEIEEKEKEIKEKEAENTEKKTKREELGNKFNQISEDRKKQSKKAKMKRNY